MSSNLLTLLFSFFSPGLGRQVAMHQSVESSASPADPDGSSSFALPWFEESVDEGAKRCSAKANPGNRRRKVNEILVSKSGENYQVAKEGSIPSRASSRLLRRSSNTDSIVPTG